ncbi:hypothetical protein JCGZ_18265 [Jatropha curcas]|uniref:Protein MIZU-KUSSEI 1 n=2 Tax=Jatropha curcas TaxID=180498 RepID=A0A067KBZ4_JATCU|nr:hypothetical protein JCGZ_18265 [Jatropha curcas]
MAKTPHDSSFSFSRRYFNWRKKVVEEDEDDDEEILTLNSTSHFSSCEEELKDAELRISLPSQAKPMVQEPKKRFSMMAVSKIRSALTVISKSHHSGSGTKLIGTLFGYRRGHVHFAFQGDTKINPGFLIQLATPTSVLVREMASGLVRIALECEKKQQKRPGKLLDEPLWRTYCNGKKSGYAIRRECGPEEWKVLKAVEPISMGAGVLPGNGARSEGELMYMRARFERVVGSKDSEAFYMMNPDGSGCPELSVYLLRV